jgi:hypothetical protein
MPTPLYKIIIKKFPASSAAPLKQPYIQSLLNKSSPPCHQKPFCTQTTGPQSTPRILGPEPVPHPYHTPGPPQHPHSHPGKSVMRFKYHLPIMQTRILILVAPFYYPRHRRVRAGSASRDCCFTSRHRPCIKARLSGYGRYTHLSIEHRLFVLFLF